MKVNRLKINKLSGLVAGLLCSTMLGATAVQGVSNPVITLAGSKGPVCNNQSNGKILVSGSGGATPYEYSFNHGAYDTTAYFSGLAAGTYTILLKDANGNLDSLQVNLLNPNKLQLAATLTAATCFETANGSIALTVSGGYGAYNYAWNGPDSFSASSKNIANIKRGTYYLHLVDALGCNIDTNFTISSPTILSTSSTITDVKCFGNSNGKIVVTPSGGTSPYSYGWTGPSSYSATTATINSLVAGNYTVSVTDANGCKTSKTLTVGTPAVLDVSLKNVFHVACFGGNSGSISTQIAGGTSPYTYNWINGTYSSGSANPSSLYKGSYALTVTDANGCEDTLSAIITEPTLLTFSATVTDVICYNQNNGKITTTTGGGMQPYLYQWSNGATTANVSGLKAATYSVTVTDSNGCKASLAKTVNQPTLLQLTYSATNVKCKNQSNGSINVFVSGGTYPWNYYHTGPVGYTPNTGTQLKNLAAGDYALSTTDANGCKDSAVVKITEPTALTNTESVVHALCFGSSGSAAVQAFGGTTPYGYEWTDTLGFVIGATASLSNLNAGHYHYSIKDANQCSITDSVLVLEPKELVLSLLSKSNPVCATDATGSVSLKLSGGTSPFQYQQNTQAFQSSANYTALTKGNYTYTAKDKNGCVDTIHVDLPNIDAVNPVLLLKKPTLYLSNTGTVSFSVTQLDSGTYDNCGLASLTAATTTFGCLNLGANTVAVTAKDVNGNESNANTQVWVKDTIKPTALVKSVNIYLNNSGVATVSANQVNNGSTDNCGVDSIAINKTSFNCLERGTQSVQLEVYDKSRNVAAKSVTINVLDTTRPIAKSKNINVYLNKAGEAIIAPKDVDNGSTDNCGIKTLTISNNFFNCSNVGSNTISFTVTDSSNNSSTQNVRITVFDTISPVVKVKTPIVYMTSQGFAVITPDDVDDKSFDNCKIASRSISKSVFTCNDLGQNIINLTIADVTGNITVAKATVVVQDTTRPKLKYRNINAYLDKNGLAAASAFDADLGTTDNCDLKLVGLTKDVFNCSELGANVVEFYATDKAGNVNRAPITITVKDTVRPVILATNIKIYLDSTGKAQISPKDIDLGSYDNCGIVYRNISQTAFDCSDVGSRILIYTIRDTSGNSSTRLLNATISDTLTPKIQTWTQVLYFDQYGKVNLEANHFIPYAYDNCGFKKFYFDDSTFDCSNTGLNTSLFYAVDHNNNITAQPFYTYVFDSIPPQVVLKTDTIYVDTLGVAQLRPENVIASIYDNCKLSNIVLGKSIFTSADYGVNYTFIEAYDVSGNAYYSGNIVKITVLLGDADRDSIPDYLETSADYDNDGVKNYLDLDSDNDGLPDLIENLGKSDLQDLDKDGYPNVWDLDSDNDKIYDVTESGGPDADKNGRFGAGRLYVTNKGVALLARDGDGLIPFDTDGDGDNDYLDVDSDEDGISDLEENLSASPDLLNSDNDALPDYRDTDSDNDGISDLIEKNDDYDNDKSPNYLDLDADNDGISDLIETNKDQDTDGFGNWLDLDSDDDKLLDIEEGIEDSDGDGNGNWLDKDADNDGIDDFTEGKFDADADGIPNYLDIDSDADGIADVIEGQPFVAGDPADTDGDGIYDYVDVDSDNDKINDVKETVSDTDGDGTGNWRDEDSDGDGVPDLLESINDTDGDGIDDAVDLDSDNDGIPDLIEGFADADGDGIPNSLDLDSDDDGINDVLDALGVDADGDGKLDAGEQPLAFVDTDKDGVMNSLDRDSDDDGIWDLYEAGYTDNDLNKDGRIDGIDTDGDGIKDAVDGLTGLFGDMYDVLAAKFDDGDGEPEFVDSDSDADGIFDSIEGMGDVDADLNDNYVDTDSDGDKIDDIVEGTLDPDEDNIGNWLDDDSDGDKIADSTELATDFDGDGTPNYLDLDSDSDELSDILETELDADKNKLPDFLDPSTFVPEIFTPNGDGINDIFYIKGLKNYPEANLIVFDNMGHVVYRSRGPYVNNWDGTQQVGSDRYLGVALKEGLYFFVLEHNVAPGMPYYRPQTKGNVYVKP